MPSVLLLALLLPTWALAGKPPAPAPVHPLVWETLQAEGEVEILIVLRAQADLRAANALPTREAKGRYVYERLRKVAEESQRDLRAVLDAQGVKYRTFFVANVIQVWASGALVHSLATRGDVARIMPNPRVKTLSPTWPELDPGRSAQVSVACPEGVEPNLLRVHADDVWDLGYTGTGVVVGGQDTGYDWVHPALKGQYRGWDGVSADHDYNWHDAIHSGGGSCGADSLEPCDGHGHGTHTMGIIVGDDGAGNRIGMAPGAEWVGCRNMDEDGYGTPATYMECFEFFLAPYPVGGTSDQGVPELAPHIVNNSWACPPWEGCDAGTLEASVEALQQAGIVVVVSTGNLGSECDTVDDPPAIYQQSFSVGAFDHNTGQIAAFSSRGPVTYGGQTYTKPDITAPGVAVCSSLRGGGYGIKSGTSMAAPHVAGAAALLLSAAPSYKGEATAIEGVLINTAEVRTTNQGCGGNGAGDVPNNVWGWGILDALGAVEGVAPHGQVQGVVTDADVGGPIAGAAVTANLTLGVSWAETRSDAAGRYALTLPVASYDLLVQARGYVSQTMTNIVVISGGVTVQDFMLAPVIRYYLPLFLADS